MFIVFVKLINGEMYFFKTPLGTKIVRGHLGDVSFILGSDSASVQQISSQEAASLGFEINKYDLNRLPKNIELLHCEPTWK